MKDNGVSKKVNLEITIDGNKLHKNDADVDSPRQVKDTVHWKALLDSITERESSVLLCKFGLFGEYEKKNSEIAKELNMSAERVRQIVLSAKRKLKHPTRRKMVDIITHAKLKRFMLC
jgi:DNA-directed RNA polymerase sigma subunit (sigma70/sigma32)